MIAHETPEEPGAQDRSTVVEVFGVKLSVKNRRLAEILTMDAAEALGLESRTSNPGGDHAVAPEVVSEAVSYTTLCGPSPDDEVEAQLRVELRQRVEAIAATLGFIVAPGGKWYSASGLTLHTRIVPHTVSAAGATDMVGKLVALMNSRSSAESILLISPSQEVIETFVRAIKERGAHALFRVASVGDLEALRAVSEVGGADHSAFVATLSPQAAVNVGAAISLLGAGSPGHT